MTTSSEILAAPRAALAAQIAEQTDSRRAHQGTIHLDRPFNLYLSQKQAKAYLRLMGTDEYRHPLHDPVRTLFEKHAATLLPGKGKIDLLDLGPGYPDKSLALLKHLRRRGDDCLYVPVDINKHFLDVASAAVVNYVSAIKPVLCLFEDLPALLRNGQILRKGAKRVVNLGLTFMNYRPREILPLLAKISGSRGRVIVATQLLQTDFKQLVRPYLTVEARKFAFLPLELSGIPERLTRYDVSFADSRVELSFRMLASFHVKDAIRLESGTRIVTAISYRYTPSRFRSCLREFFSQATTLNSENKEVTVGLARQPNQDTL